jgi:chromosome segregation ATPase
MSDMMDEVLYAVGRGVKQLRGDMESVAEKGRVSEMEARALDRQVTGLNATIVSLRDERAKAHIDKQKLQSDIDSLREIVANRILKWDELLAEYDSITLGLSLLIPELEAHRDNASTKAAGIAYGHVVERLLGIHTPAGHGQASA